MDNKLDRRVLKSKAAIEKAFVELILKYGFDKINVKQITERANVARKTFYQNEQEDSHLFRLEMNCAKLSEV